MLEHQEKRAVINVRSEEECNEMTPPDISRRLEELREHEVASSTF